MSDKKITEMIDAKCALDSVLGERALAKQNSGVVYENIQPIVPLFKFACETSNGSLRGEVTNHQLDRIVAALLRDLLPGSFDSLAVAANHHHCRAHFGEPECCLLADAGVRPSNQADFPDHNNLRLERLSEIVDQVIGRFDSDGNADEAVGD